VIKNGTLEIYILRKNKIHMVFLFHSKGLCQSIDPHITATANHPLASEQYAVPYAFSTKSKYAFIIS
jgi:hypothetical protein